MDALLGAAQWVVGKALAPVADGLLEAWGASKNLGLNIEALKMELLLVKATLEVASGKQIRGQAMEELLGKLRHSAQCAEDLLDELDYFCIHDKLHGTYDAADQHAKGGLHHLALNARHTAKAVGKFAFASSSCWPAVSPAGDAGDGEDAKQRVSCCPWPHARKRSLGNSSLVPNSNQEVSGFMPKLGKLLPCLSSAHVRDDNSGQPIFGGAPQRETSMLGFNRVDISERMKYIVEQLQPVRTEFTKILQSCDRMTALDIAQTRPITTNQSIEPELHGRDHIVDTIIHDMTKGRYLNNDLSVLPIVGPGGIGKTTLLQHIHRNQQVQNHFQVVIWVCVSVKFNLNKLLEEIKTCIPKVEGEKEGRAEELIEHRLKSKRYLLVLDDIWEVSDEDDWKRLLLPLNALQEKGSMILVTTRFPAIAKMVRTTDHSIELEGLESKYITGLFHAFVFGSDQCKRDHSFLLETGDKIMVKLKGSPLAAKTVGRLLRNNLSLCHWIRVLESKEWETQNGVSDIMPALKLSYDHIPFHQQQCFFYSALFPEDYMFSATELINLWIGLDILQSVGRNQTLENIGLNNLNDLVTRGFFREEERYGSTCYVMHDLLHDLALQVASRECLTVHHANVRSVEVQPSIRHLSIFIDRGDAVSHENFKSQLRKLKTRLNAKQLHTLMIFGEMDESFANILGDFFMEVNALRVLCLVNMAPSAESMLHYFPSLVHLRYICLGTRFSDREIHLPLAISRSYHLRILDLGRWYGCHDFPTELANLAKLCRIYTPIGVLSPDICNVGKLRLLEELKVFRVNKESEGFEPSQLENLTELRELGIYNLENIHTKEEAAEAKLIEKNYLQRLTLHWDSKRSNTEPDVEVVVLESLNPHRFLRELRIEGHKGPSCPTWLSDKLIVEALQSLHLSGVSWQCLPPLEKMWGLDSVILEHIATVKEFTIEQSFRRLTRLELVCLRNFRKWVTSEDVDHMFPLLQVLRISHCPELLEFPFSNHIDYPSAAQYWNIDWFPKLRDLTISGCPELLLLACIPWTETLRLVCIWDIKLVETFAYDSKESRLSIEGKDDLKSLDQVLAFSNLTSLEQLSLHKCPPLQLKNLLVLNSLKKLTVQGSDCLVGLVGGEGDKEWQHPVEHLMVLESRGKDLSELLTHLPSLSRLEINDSEKITSLAVGEVLQQTTSSKVQQEKQEEEEEEDGLLLLPPHLSDSLRELAIESCSELAASTFLPGRGRGGLQALRSLQRLMIRNRPKILSAKKSFPSPCCSLFPASLQHLSLVGVEGMGTLESLSNLTSLTTLELWSCGKDLSCKGLLRLLTAGGQLTELVIRGSPLFFAGWDANPGRVLQQVDGGEEQELPAGSCKLQMLETDDAMGLLVSPICSFLSSSLTRLVLCDNENMERFTKEQEDALHLLASLQQLEFSSLDKLQSLPAGLHKLTGLKRLMLSFCLAVGSLPKDGLPKSLQELDVSHCYNEELTQQCRGLVGTIPKIKLHHGD